MRLFVLLAAAAAATCVLASPVTIQVERRAADPVVKIRNGTVIGSTSQSVDTFNAIPFAQPPTGTLRLKPPKTITKTFGTFTAKATPTACPQFIATVPNSGLVGGLLGLLEQLPFFQNITTLGTSEDCLTLNVIRPSGVKAGAKLPVLAYIYGGGFEAGSSTLFGGTGVVQKSMQLNHPVIWVAMNYRVGGYGFLAGKELQKDGSTNLGLRDQRLALQWIQENVAAFGGDPDKVTIWGESAGAISVFDQMLINNGDHTYRGKPLFRAGLMNSGSASPARDVASSKAQAVYDAVVKNGGCANAADTLKCLRALPPNKFQAAVTSVPGLFNYQSVDLAYVPRPDPASNFFATSPDFAIQAGKYAKVPVIIGDQEDEGPLFALTLSNITTDAQVLRYIADYFPGVPIETVKGLVDAYPTDLAAGSPFRTGQANNFYPQFKRLAAILGDIIFTLSRRVALSYLSRTIPTYSYLATYLHGTPLLGTFHGSDLIVDQVTIPGVPRDSILTYYLSFVYYKEPNRITAPTKYPVWPLWNETTPTLINFESQQVSYLPDTFRSAQYQALQKVVGILQI